jgi:hypothetical protein
MLPVDFRKDRCGAEPCPRRHLETQTSRKARKAAATAMGNRIYLEAVTLAACGGEFEV